jgi:hypothetical protein
VKVPESFARWPLLLAGMTLVSAGVALDLSTQAPVAFGLFALAAASFGGFVYAEGARHRDWLDAQERERLDSEPEPWSDGDAPGRIDPPP